MTVDASPPPTHAAPTHARRAGSATSTTCRAFAAAPLPLEDEGTLVRVTGLVLEAAGIRVPVGSVCEVRMPGASRPCWPKWSASTATAPS